MFELSVNWTVWAALAATLSALFAALYTWLTYRLVRAQTEPNLIVYVRHDESRPSLVQIVIENIGRGLATDVTFESSMVIPAHAFGITEDKAGPAEKMTDGPLIEGIPSLGPGDSRKIAWGQYGGLRKAIGDEVITVTCKYRHGTRAMPPVTCKLDVRSFKGTDAVGSEGARVIKELKRLADAAETIARPSGRAVPAQNTRTR